MGDKKKDFLQDLHNICQKHDVQAINVYAKLETLEPTSIVIIYKNNEEIELPLGLDMITLRQIIYKQD